MIIFIIERNCMIISKRGKKVNNSKEIRINNYPGNLFTIIRIIKQIRNQS